MAIRLITRDEVIKNSKSLPVFPIILNQILNTIADPDANMHVLANYVKSVPVMTSRVLAVVNMKASERQRPIISDISVAISLLGMGSIRELALISSTGNFVKNIELAGAPSLYWQHSIAVGVCGQELARHMSYSNKVAESAMIAGLLHDIGKIWLLNFYPEATPIIFKQKHSDKISLCEAEKNYFGVDHATVGGWLAEYWSQPADIVAAVRYHHSPDLALSHTLVPLVHVAEILSNALDLTGRIENRVTKASTPAFKALGLIWGDISRPKFTELFGRMEARSHYASMLFDSAH